MAATPDGGETARAVYLAQHQNTVPTAGGRVRNEPVSLFKVGFGCVDRPYKGAGQNVAPWIVHYQWEGTTMDDEKSCQQFLKALGMHVENSHGTEWC